MKREIILVENDASHGEAMRLLDRLSAEQDRKTLGFRRAQALLVREYERRRWPSKAATPGEILKYLMEEHDLKPADLAAVLGTRSRVSEIMGGKRQLTLAMIRRLRARFHISADALIGT